MGADEPNFDQYAAGYDDALTAGISISGENKDYFASRRVDWMSKRLAELGCGPKSVLEFGCGTGTNLGALAPGINTAPITKSA